LPRASTPARARSAKAAQSDGRRQSVRAVAIGASLLSTLGKFGGNATLSELAAAAHLPLSKAHRYLRALIDSAFVEQDATGNYRLGSEALALGLAALAGIDLVALATPLIADLSTQVNETIVLSIWANHGATVVHVKEPPRRVTVVTRIGSVLPLLTSATGLVFAAYLPAEEIDAMKVIGVNPIQALVVPRVIAATFVALMLYSVVAVVGLSGSYFFVVFVQHVTPGAFVAGMTLLTGLPQVVVSLVKALLFGLSAGLIACYKGLHVGGGPTAVGNAVNETVVFAFMALFLINILATAFGVKVTP